MNQLIEIRAMQVGDVNAVTHIYAEVFDGKYVGFGELSAGMAEAPANPSREAVNLFQIEISERLKNDLHNGLFVAAIENNVVGFAIAVLSEREGDNGLECWLNDLGVSQQWQRHGIGRLLVQHVLDWALRERGAKYCLLESGFQNEAAHHFFEHLGFSSLSVVFWKGAS